METYKQPMELVDNPRYQDQRQQHLAGLGSETIDAPIIDLIDGFNALAYCFTIQSCYGHFIYHQQNDRYNCEPLPSRNAIEEVEYRIAYICLCVANNVLGRGLLEALSGITAIDPENIQFCCAEWFWKRQVNSYALQVQPDRFKNKDIAILEFKEALHIEKIRNEFFFQLQKLIQKQQ